MKETKLQGVAKMLNDAIEKLNELTDPYAHLEEAQARGETIQLKTSTRLNTWVDMDDMDFIMGFAYSPESYRIKPKTVKKWRWVMRGLVSDWWITDEHYGTPHEAETHFDYGTAIQRIDSTMIEIEE